MSATAEVDDAQLVAVVAIKVKANGEKSRVLFSRYKGRQAAQDAVDGLDRVHLRAEIDDGVGQHVRPGETITGAK